jgi:hypothetical protein
VDDPLAQRIEQLRRARMSMRRIAAVVGRSVATVSRFLAGLGLSSLKALDPVQPIVCYEHEAPGELLHMDTKKLGRIVRPSHRVTGNRHDTIDGAGWEFAHVAIDDHSRAGFLQMRSDERKGIGGRLPQSHCGALPTSDQRQDRTVHRDLPSRVGLRPYVEQQRRAHRLVGRRGGPSSSVAER